MPKPETRTVRHTPNEETITASRDAREDKNLTRYENLEALKRNSTYHQNSVKD